MKSNNKTDDQKNFVYYNSFNSLFLVAFIPFEIFAIVNLSLTPSGRLIFGGVMMAILIVQIIVSPFIGNLLDSFPRKTVIMRVILLQLAFALIISFLWEMLPEYEIIFIITLFMLVNITEGIFFDAMRSMQQTISSPVNIGKGNGFSEISGQLPSIIGPAMAIPVLTFLGPLYSLALSTVILILTVPILMRVKENFTVEKKVMNKNTAEKKEGAINYMKKNPSKIIFAFLLNMPFIMVATGNFLKPVFIVSTLHAGLFGLSLSEMVYASFASTLGLVLSVTRWKNEIVMMYGFFILYIFGTFLMPTSPILFIFLIYQSFHGIGNPGVRVSRNTFLMKRIDAQHSGRFFSSVTFLSTTARLMLLVFFTLTVNTLGTTFLFDLSGFILVASLTFSIILMKNQEMRNFMRVNRLNSF